MPSALLDVVAGVEEHHGLDEILQVLDHTIGSLAQLFFIPVLKVFNVEEELAFKDLGDQCG